MVRSKTKFPREGEFVVGKVNDIEDQYVYVDLIDYEGLNPGEYAQGMVHISEISSRWIKNIRNFVKIGQRVVFRVLRVDSVKGHVDLSIRKVNSAQRENRMKEWKYALKFENLLQFLSEAKGLTPDEVYNMLGWSILDKFNTYQETIEELKENGKKILDSIKNVPDDVKEAFLKIADENVKITTVDITGKIKLSFNADNGIDLIKDSLKGAKDLIVSKEFRSLSIHYLGAPYYRIEIISKDYLDAESILSDALEYIENKAKSHNGTFEFIRD